MTARFTRPILLAIASVSTLALVAPAQAERQGAPIVFGEAAGAPAPAPYQAPAASAPQAQISLSPGDAKSRRLEFRYPDQPDVYYGDGGARAAEAGNAPMAFSSSTAAIDPAQARQFAALPEAPLMPAAPRSIVPSDPNITSGGFDARAAAARFAEERAAAPTQPIRVTANASNNATPVGKPLTLSRVSVNREATMSEEAGKAGVYTEGFEGRPTANGEIYEGSAMTAAHPTLPLPSLVQVINQNNGREIVVRVNDRGPFAGNRILDLTPRAAQMLGYAEGQTANVRVRYLGPAPVAQVQNAAAPTDVMEESLAPVAVPPMQSAAYTPEPARMAAPFNPPVSEPKLSGAEQGNFYIQAGSFADIGNAQRLTDALGRRLSVEITQARVRNADYFRVMIGPFSTRREADVQRAQLQRSGIVDGLVVER